MIRIVQLNHPNFNRRVAIVDGSVLQLLNAASVYQLANDAITSGTSLSDAIAGSFSGERLDYDSVYAGKSEWCLLPAFDHPDEPARCLVTGTGLTHRKSAENRQAMHAAEKEKLTDSMRMYHWGVEGGRPAPGQIGVPPEWFYKGCGAILRAHGEALDVPWFAEDGGDEPEVAGVYIIAPDGEPKRIGLVQGNEFSDHKMEEKNYLYLAPSKLRTCSIGPELIVDGEFGNLQGKIRIERGGKEIWSHPFLTGEQNMCHTIANLEHHHFKYPAHRRPGDAHIHFFGADVFSFGEGVSLCDGDVMEIELESFGRPLRNEVRLDRSPSGIISVQQL